MKINARYATAGFALSSLLLGTTSFLSAQNGDSDGNRRFEFALVGDVPYAPVATVGGNNLQIYPAPDYDAMISDINAHRRVLFTVHMGDIKAGNTWCVGGSAAKDPAGAANIYTANRDLFNTYRNAAVYLYGDNEWTDCHRTNNGAYDPQERLNYLRSIFRTSNKSLGRRPITLTRQASYSFRDPVTSTTKMWTSDNVMWRTGDILFVGLNQPGSNNNFQRNVTASSPAPTDDSNSEYRARDKGNIDWINEVFNSAMEDSSVRAIVIMQQANPFERFLETGQGYTESGYAALVQTLRNQTVAWGKPVFFVGGDTHTIRIDKPLTAVPNPAGGFFTDAAGNVPGFPALTAANGVNVQTTPTQNYNTTNGTWGCTTVSATCITPVRVQNFTRVEVFGSPDVAWVRGIVDPTDPNVLSFSMQTTPGTGRGEE